MKVLERGHIYAPQQRKPDGKLLPVDKNTPKITFVSKEAGREHNGTTTQEVIRCLIDRTRHCANCMPHPNNERIIYHLRMALILHECRALERRAEKGEITPEHVVVEHAGHFALQETIGGENETTDLLPYRHDWDRPCNHNAGYKEEE